jgi:hypothetical protein
MVEVGGLRESSDVVQEGVHVGVVGDAVATGRSMGPYPMESKSAGGLSKGGVKARVDLRTSQ